MIHEGEQSVNILKAQEKKDIYKIMANIGEKRWGMGEKVRLFVCSVLRLPLKGVVWWHFCKEFQRPPVEYLQQGMGCS